MMRLRCLASGSHGNCYLLENETECLAIDAGIKITEVKKELDFNVSKIAGVVISHVHMDHSLAIKDFEKMGIPVFRPYEYKMKLGFIKYGGFTIQSFKVPHDGTPCCGFLIRHNDMCGQLLYLTDLEYCPYTFKKQDVGTMIVEANYSNEYIGKDEAKYSHVKKGHCEINTTLGIIEANKTDALRNVILAHLSLGSADPIQFKAKVEKVAKCPVYVADNGMEIDLNIENCPFM